MLPDKNSVFPCTEPGQTAQGISLRDYFAAQALGRLVAAPHFSTDYLANTAYKIADAMMQARTMPVDN